MDAGTFTNTVKANATAVRGSDPAEAQAQATVTTEAAAAALTVTKSANPTSGVKVGDTVTYTVKVTNSGNVKVTGLTLTDDHGTPTGFVTELEAGADTGDITYTYTVTQADVDAGTFTNTVKANATAVRGDDPEEVEATATVKAEDAAAKLSITKVASKTENAVKGDTITYTVVVKNTGNVTVKAGKLEDDHADLSGESFELAPNESATFTYTYTVTQADMDAGEIVNTVKANAKAVRGSDPAEVNANATVDVEMDGHLTVDKVTTSKPANGEKYVLGEEITYKITVKNDGNLTITNITVTDELTGGEWQIESLAPNASKEFETSYVVTEDDVLAGKVVNVATATGDSPDPDEPDVPVEPGEDPEPTDIRKDMTVDSESLKVKYDGKSHTVTAKSNVDDATIEYSIDGGSTWSKTAPSLTDVGVITFSVRATRTGYETVQKHGFKLEVTPREITLTSASGSKWYDGTPLRNQTVTVSEDGFVDGEGATYNITGSQTNVGQSANAFTYTLNANTKASNYRITTAVGVLTVLPEEVPLGMIGTFSFYFMSDGNLKADGKKADAYKDIFDWIKKNNERLGALAIIGSGNAVADGKDEDAWKLIKDELDNLERKPNELPYYNIAGTNEVNGDELDYETYTKNKLCEVNERNEYEDGQIWYQPYDEQQLLFVGIGYQKLLDPEKATDEEKEAQEKWLKYVNDVLARYPEYTAVLLVNDFIEHDPDSKKDDGRLTEFGELIEKRIVAGNDNVALVLCGSAEGTARWHKAYGERNVNAIMYNYQGDEENGLGFFRIITLNGEAKTITVTTYSPTLDKDSYDEDHPEYDFYVIENAF